MGKDYEIWAVDHEQDCGERWQSLMCCCWARRCAICSARFKATVGDSAPVAVIDALAYGRCNGAAILKQAEDLVNNG